MNISIGSASSSSLSSGSSESSLRPPHRYPNPNHHIHDQATSYSEGERFATKGLVFDRENESKALYGYSANAAPTSETGEAHQRGEDAFYSLQSRDSVSPRFTPSNSAPYSPSLASSSAPPPLPPSPPLMGVLPAASYKRELPLTALTASLGRAPGEDTSHYLKRADPPADPSLSSPPPNVAASPSAAFARTASPSPLQGARADAPPVPSRTSGNAEIQHDSAAACVTDAAAWAKGTSGRPFMPLHIPTLQSLSDPMDGGSEAGLASADMRGLSETPESGGARPFRLTSAAAVFEGGAAALPSRSAPPLPRPAAPSAAPLMPLRLQSRSAESSQSSSLPYAGEPRLSLGRAGEDAAAYSEERQPWRDEVERAGSVSVTEYGARPPSHAPTMHREPPKGGPAEAGDENEVGGDAELWQQRAKSASHLRSLSRSDNVSAHSSCSHHSTASGAVGGAGREKESESHQMTLQYSSSSALASSASSSPVPSPLMENVPPLPISRPILDSVVVPDADYQTLATKDTAAAAAVPARTPTSSESEEAVVSSIAVSTPADTARSSTVGERNHTNENLNDGMKGRNGNYGIGSQRWTDHTEATDESPPPLPAAPHNDTSAMRASSRQHARGSASQEHHATHKNACLRRAPLEAQSTETSADRPSYHPDSNQHHGTPPQEKSALDRWRSGATGGERQTSPSPTPRSTQSARSEGKCTAALVETRAGAHLPSDAIVYQGGVDFVRWVPSSVGRDADFSSAALTPPRRARKAHPTDGTANHDTSGDVGNHTTTIHSTAPQIVAVPLVPSPHRKPHRSASTTAVLAEVDRRRASPTAVSSGSGCSPTASDPRPQSRVAAKGQRMRLTTITSPQRARVAHQFERAYADSRERETTSQGGGAEAGASMVAEDRDRPRNLLSSAPVDAWTRQPSGQFLSINAPSTTSKSSERSLDWRSNAAKHALGERTALSASSDVHCRHRENPSSAVARHSCWARVRPELETAMAARSLHVSSLSEPSSQAASSCDGNDGASTFSAVVRAWRPLSAVVPRCVTEQQKPMVQRNAVWGREEAEAAATPVSRWHCGVSGQDFRSGPSPLTQLSVVHPAMNGPATAAGVNAALSIDVSGPLPPSSPPFSHLATTSAGESRTDAVLTSISSTTIDRATGISAGYAAVYSPRTLASRVVRARDVLLLGAAPPSSPPLSSFHESTHHTSRALADAGAPLRMSSAPAPSFPTRVSPGVAGGSRVMPAIGAAVSVSAEMNVPPPPQQAPHTRVDLSRASPLRGPPVSEVLLNSYDDTGGVASFAGPTAAVAAPLVGSLARPQAKKAVEPWSLFLERDSSNSGEAGASFTGAPRLETSLAHHRDQRAYQQLQQQQERGGVARRIPFGVGSEGGFSSKEHHRHSLASEQEQRPREDFSSAHESRWRGEGEENWDHRWRVLDRDHHHHRSAQLSLQPSQHSTESGDAPTQAGERRGGATSTVGATSIGQFGNRRRSSSAAEGGRDSAAVTTQRPSMTSSATILNEVAEDRLVSDRNEEGLRARAERHLHQSHLLEQQRILQEETFRRRQIVMQEAHSFSIEVTELNYQRAVLYVQRAAASTAVVVAVPSASQAPPSQAVRRGETVREAERWRSAGLSAVRQDQAAMALSLGELSKELDSISF